MEILIRQATKSGWIKCEVGGCLMGNNHTVKQEEVESRITEESALASKQNAKYTRLKQTLIKNQENKYVTCALRTRTYRGQPQTLEIGGGISNSITTVTKDFMIMDEIYNKALDTVPKDCEIRIRKLTPKECWRLMDFDDADIEKAKAAGVSNSQLYRQAGNSIVVNCLCHIFQQML